MILATFPGQGSQTVGMGKDVYEYFPVAHKIFEEADDILGFGLSKLTFSGTEEELRITTNAQTALFTTCIAILKALECKCEQPIDSFVQMLAGHSMGQYTALCAAQSIKFADALSLLKIRSKLMDTAPSGSMLACLNTPIEILTEVIEKAKAYGMCCVANYNSSTQTILSGETKAISFAESELNKLKYKTVMLKVSGAFHSPLMQESASLFEEFVNKTDFTVPKIPIINNVTGIRLESDNIKKSLIEQVVNSVRWTQGIDYFLEFTRDLNILDKETKKKNLQQNALMPLMLEIGPNAVLTNLARRDNKPMQFVNVANVANIDSFISSLISK